MNFKVFCKTVVPGCGFELTPVVVSVKNAKRARTLARRLLEDKGYIVHAVVSVKPTSEEVTFPDVKPRKYGHKNFILDIGNGTGRRVENALRRMWKDAERLIEGKTCPECGKRYELHGMGYPFTDFAVIFATCGCGEYSLPDFKKIPRKNKATA